jgi:hypothetical protein
MVCYNFSMDEHSNEPHRLDDINRKLYSKTLRPRSTRRGVFSDKGNMSLMNGSLRFILQTYQQTLIPKYQHRFLRNFSFFQE